MTAGMIALLAATVSCATAFEDGPPARSDDEEPLTLSVDYVDILHGALRVSATMVDGSADLSVSLGAGCEPREVGGGIATPSRFVWTFSADELADALSCGFLVRAISATATRRVTKTASLPVAVEVTTLDSDDAPQLPDIAPEDIAHAVLLQRPLSVGGYLFEAALSVGGTAIEAASE
jgi:hypothetical protein